MIPSGASKRTDQARAAAESGRPAARPAGSRTGCATVNLERLALLCYSPNMGESLGSLSPRTGTSNTRAAEKPDPGLSGVPAAAIKSMLDEQISAVSVPGAAVALVSSEDVVFACSGVTNLDHPLEVTGSTFFRIASITKTFTSYAAVSELDAAGIDLDNTVAEVLGPAQLSQTIGSAQVTFRHLLTHTAGWDGDYIYANYNMHSFGHGREGKAALLSAMADAPQLTPPGSRWHYNNSAFWVLAEIISELSASRYEDYVREKIAEPLQIQSSFFAEDIITRRVASGHLRQNGILCRNEPWDFPGPAASASGGLVATIQDLGQWAQHWLRIARKQVQARPAIAEMLCPQTAAGSLCDAMGLGWMLDDLGGKRIIKHGGSAAGQQSRLTLIPAANLGLVVLANSGEGHTLEAMLADRLLWEPLGLRPRWAQPAKPVPSALARDLQGEYASSLHRFGISAEGRELVLQERSSRAALQGRSSPPPPAPPIRLRYRGKEKFVAIDPPFRNVGLEIVRENGSSRRVLWRGRLCEKAER